MDEHRDGRSVGGRRWATRVVAGGCVMDEQDDERLRRWWLALGGGKGLVMDERLALGGAHGGRELRHG